MLSSFVLDTLLHSFFFFFFNDPATTEIYTLPLHDALPICCGRRRPPTRGAACRGKPPIPSTGSAASIARARDRKSTRLNSSHVRISYAVFCLKKKKKLNLRAVTIMTLTLRLSEVSHTYRHY